MQRTHDFFPKTKTAKALDTLRLVSSLKPGVVLKGPHRVSFQTILKSDLRVAKDSLQK